MHAWGRFTRKDPHVDSHVMGASNHGACLTAEQLAMLLLHSMLI